MNINEVSTTTGLSEDTIRFYIEKKLISPNMQWNKGREYIEFSEKDLKDLELAVIFRKAYFEFDEIFEMKIYNFKIPEVVKKWYSRLNDKPTKYHDFIESFKDVDIQSFQNMNQVVNYIQVPASTLPLPILDKEPYFKGIDDMTQDEKIKEVNKIYDKKNKQYQIGKVVVITMVILIMINQILSFVQTKNVFALLINTVLVFFLYQGYTWARFVYTFFIALAVIITCIALTIGDISMISTFDLVVIITLNVIYCASIILLLFHKGVKEFLYHQRY